MRKISLILFALVALAVVGCGPTNCTSGVPDTVDHPNQ
jgi:hypothetical protein